MSPWLPHALVIIVGSMLGSGGFWKFLEHRNKKNSAHSRLMMGIAYKEITTVGLHYIERGWITKDELEEFEKYFVRPYKELGGNGIAERIWSEVRVLPFQKHAQHDEIFRNERYLPDVTVLAPVNGQQNAAA